MEECRCKRVRPTKWVYNDLKWWAQFPGFRFWKKYTGGVGFFRAVRNVCRHSIDRLRYGASWYDWINFDTYLAALLANAAHDFRNHGVGGYPGNMTKERWHAELLKIETAFRKWVDDDLRSKMSTEEEKALYEECQEALFAVALHFGSFWD